MSAIVSITPKGANASDIFVNSDYAKELERFLCDKRVTTNQLHGGSIVQRVCINSDGGVEKTLDIGYMAMATPAALESIIGEWILTLVR